MPNEAREGGMMADATRTVIANLSTDERNRGVMLALLSRAERAEARAEKAEAERDEARAQAADASKRLRLIYFADGSSREVESEVVAVEYRVLCAKEIEHLKTQAEANAAAAHALEVIERDKLGTFHDTTSTPRVSAVTVAGLPGYGEGPTIIAAVDDYEQRKTKETK